MLGFHYKLLMQNEGLLQMAMFVHNKLKKDGILMQALNFDLNQGSKNYSLIVVGHSIAAGVAAILAVALRPEFPTLCCYAYSPPSGVVRENCIPETQSFITSIVVGKDLVPRIGASQVRTFRRHLLDALAACHHSKWRIICGGTCCDFFSNPLSARDVGLAMQSEEGLTHRQMVLESQPPMYLPGKVIHVIRSHPKAPSNCPCSSKEAVFQAIWAENYDFGEILISPTMLSDHSPYIVFDALQKVLTHVSPAKPSRKPMKQRGIGLTPNTSSNICEPSQSDLHLHQTDLEMDLSLRSHAISNLKKHQSSSWHDLVRTSNAYDLSGVRLKERPKHFSLVPRQHVLEVRPDDWNGPAPLASPEVLSETSSLASFGSGGGSMRQTGHHRLTSVAGRMDPIKQSPLTHPVHRREYCLVLEPRSEKEEQAAINCIILSPSNNGHLVLKQTSGDDSEQNRAVRCHATDNLKCANKNNLISLSVENSIVSSTPVSFHVSESMLGHHNQVADVEVYEQRESISDISPIQRTEKIKQNSFALSEGAVLIDVLNNISMDSLELEDLNLQDINYLSGDDRNTRLYPNFRTSSSTAPVLKDFDRDSLESNIGRQYLYDEYVGHYSPAGRGYPHGFNSWHTGPHHLIRVVHSVDDIATPLSTVNCETYALPSGDESNISSHQLEGVHESETNLNESHSPSVTVLSKKLAGDSTSDLSHLVDCYL